MASDSAFERLRVAVRAAVPAEDALLIAVSGGPDSVALACAAHATLTRVTLAHVNHGWRGTEADEDEEFVRALAEQLALPLQTARLDRSPRSETDARDLRYDALERLRSQSNSTGILLGHTLDDQAETVLLNLFRGAGVRGLGGMEPRSGLLVRPFLSIERSTILRALEEIGQSYRIDRSNLDTAYRRNWLRAHVIPSIQERLPGASRSIARAAALLRDDADYLESEAAHIAGIIVIGQDVGSVRARIGAWRNLHPSLQRGTLRHLAATVLGDTRDLTEDHIERLRSYLLDPGPSPLDQLPRELHAQADGKTFRLWVGNVREPFNPVGPDREAISGRPRRPAGTVPNREDVNESRDSSQEFPESTLQVPGRLAVPGGEIVAEVWEDPDELQRRAIVVAGPMHALLDAAAIGSALTVRSRRPGDRTRPQHGSGSRSVQDLFVDRRIPRAARATIPIVLSAGRIVWIPGVAIDERFAATDATRPIAHLVMTPKTGA
ncbi:MAG TPA: tRNA lysidine(34) synthetase TilS [Chloroflexota bacterium]|nr:tRNA lysidine(34) synthetase TilS [Chloroflexota bacterium]